MVVHTLEIDTFEVLYRDYIVDLIPWCSVKPVCNQ
jgi:hypothetical protein